ncbi:hypothetical protein [Nitriliruptor alkaliphilus]|uniref:hypothetical protein n=1 Tax=Nitriliruptor alkaliphilus TaxID=427918 RepID=UPI000697D536|nr:hypothetical protein [Nitriliruptor alkaliphilus]
MRIGVIDLDTSHPAAFSPLLRDQGHDVVAVLGGRTVVDDASTRAYAREHRIASVVTDPVEMAGLVDAVFVHSVDWNLHLDRVRVLAEHDIPVHVGKPFAGRASDLRELVELEAAGARICGGSALRWSSVVQAWVEAGRTARMGFAASFGHPLDYGVHAYSLLQGLLGPGIEAARTVDGRDRLVELRWRDGRCAVVGLVTDRRSHRYPATVVTDDGVEHLDAADGGLYGPFLDVTVPYLAGELELPITFGELVEPELAAIAALASSHHGGAWIGLVDDPRIDDVSFDSTRFVADYRAARRERLGLAPR